MFGVEKIQNKFKSNYWDGLPDMIEKYKRTAAPFIKGWMNKGTRALYNCMCFYGASIALMEENEEEFLKQLNMIEKEEEYEMKPFILALYYRGRQRQEEAKECYQKFLNCKPQSKDVKIIMDNLFGEEMGNKEPISGEILGSFRNCAILKLFEENKLR